MFKFRLVFRIFGALLARAEHLHHLALGSFPPDYSHLARNRSGNETHPQNGKPFMLFFFFLYGGCRVTPLWEENYPPPGRWDPKSPISSPESNPKVSSLERFAKHTMVRLSTLLGEAEVTTLLAVINCRPKRDPNLSAAGNPLVAFFSGRTDVVWTPSFHRFFFSFFFFPPSGMKFCLLLTQGDGLFLHPACARNKRINKTPGDYSHSAINVVGSFGTRWVFL